MVKTRVIGVVLVKDGVAVQSLGFKRYLPIGAPEIAVNYLDRWGIDEIAVLKIGAAPNQPFPAEQVRLFARQCQVPLSIGGGIRTTADIKRTIQAGADKVVINAALIDEPTLVTRGAELFGNQSIVASLDVRRQSAGRFEVFTHSGTRATGLTAADLASRAEALGAGEILLNSIDQDGSKAGFDLELIGSVAQACHLPVIACGGAGHPEHLRQAMATGISGVAAGNFFHFTEHSVITAKRYLRSHGANIRLDSAVDYAALPLGEDGRVTKQSDPVLQALRFHYIPEERI